MLIYFLPYPRPISAIFLNFVHKIHKIKDKCLKSNSFLGFQNKVGVKVLYPISPNGHNMSNRHRFNVDII